MDGPAWVVVQVEGGRPVRLVRPTVGEVDQAIRAALEGMGEDGRGLVRGTLGLVGDLLSRPVIVGQMVSGRGMGEVFF